MTARVSMLLKSRASLTCFRVCFLPDRAKDLSAPRVLIGNFFENLLICSGVLICDQADMVNSVDLFFKLYFTLDKNTYQPTNAHIISHKTLLKHFKTLRHVSILSDHHQGALFLVKVILQYSQFNSYLQTRCCGSISCCVGMCCGAVARCAS